MPQKTRLTAEDLWRLGEGDVRRELVNGALVVREPAGAVHGKLTTRIAVRLGGHVERHGGGVVLTGDIGFVLDLAYDRERVRAPDVAFVSTGRLPGGKLPSGFLHGAPDLVVEILSPSDTPADVQQKLRDWLEGGARLVWWVVPDTRSVTLYRPDGSARLVCEGEVLDGEDVLPGFRLLLNEIFG